MVRQERFGIECERTAADDDRMVGFPMLRPNRNTRQREHVENVRDIKLVREGKTDQIHVGQRRAGLQSKERLAGSSEMFFHVLPGGETALAPDALNAVCQLVQEKEAVVGHPNIVEVRVTEGESHIDLFPSIPYGVGFVPGIAGRFYNITRDFKHFLTFLDRLFPIRPAFIHL